MKTYIKSILALATAALLGSSAWAASVNVQLVGTEAKTVTSSSQVTRNYYYKFVLDTSTSASTYVSSGNTTATKASSRAAVSTTFTGKKFTPSSAKITLQQCSSQNGTYSTLDTFTVYVAQALTLSVNAGESANLSGHTGITTGSSNWTYDIVSGSDCIDTVTITANTTATKKQPTITVKGKAEGSAVINIYSDANKVQLRYQLTVTVAKAPVKPLEFEYEGVNFTVQGAEKSFVDGELLLTFLSSGSMTIDGDLKNVKYLVVGGGGSGEAGRNSSSSDYQGNGGGGAKAIYKPSETLSANTYQIVVGEGGPSSIAYTSYNEGNFKPGTAGSPSSFAGVTAAGGTAGTDGAKDGSSPGTGGSELVCNITGSDVTYGKNGKAASDGIDKRTKGEPGVDGTGEGGQGGRGNDSGKGGNGVVILRVPAQKPTVDHQPIEIEENSEQVVEFTGVTEAIASTKSSDATVATATAAKEATTLKVTVKALKAGETMVSVDTASCLYRVPVTVVEEQPDDGFLDLSIGRTRTKTVTTDSTATTWTKSVTGSGATADVTRNADGTATVSITAGGTIGSTATIEIRGDGKLVKVINVTVITAPDVIDFKGREVEYQNATVRKLNDDKELLITFTDPSKTGTLIIPEDAVARVLVVGGGAGGATGKAGSNTKMYNGSGGNAGQVIEKTLADGFVLPAGSYTVTVGAGGAAAPENSSKDFTGGGKGENSSLVGGVISMEAKGGAAWGTNDAESDGVFENGSKMTGGDSLKAHDGYGAAGNNDPQDDSNWRLGISSDITDETKDYGVGGVGPNSTTKLNGTNATPNTGNGGDGGAKGGSSGTGGSGFVCVRITYPDPIYVETFSVTPILKGDALFTSAITLSMTNAAGVAVAGDYDWTERETVPTASGNYTVRFTPNDQTAYSVVELTANVVVLEPQEPTVTVVADDEIAGKAKTALSADYWYFVVSSGAEFINTETMKLERDPDSGTATLTVYGKSGVTGSAYIDLYAATSADDELNAAGTFVKRVIVAVLPEPEESETISVEEGLSKTSTQTSASVAQWNYVVEVGADFIETPELGAGNRPTLTVVGKTAGTAIVDLFSGSATPGQGTLRKRVIVTVVGPTEGYENRAVGTGLSITVKTEATVDDSQITSGSGVTVSNPGTSTTIKGGSTVGATAQVRLYADGTLVKVVNVRVTAKPSTITWKKRTVSYLGGTAEEQANGDLLITLTDSDGLLEIPEDAVGDILVVGGGGSGSSAAGSSGGYGGSSYKGNGGGGAKALYETGLVFAGGVYTATVGAGGATTALPDEKAGSGNFGSPSEFTDGDKFLKTATGGMRGEDGVSSGNASAGKGGAELVCNITGSDVTYGANGAGGTNGNGAPGGANTGNGGTGGGPGGTGGAGGSGVIIVRLKAFIETPVVLEAVTGTITYGETATDAVFAGKMKNGAGEEVDGTFAWANAGAVQPLTVEASGTEYDIVFTPKNTTYYLPATVKGTLIVNPVAITVTACDTNMLVGCTAPQFKYEVTSGELVGTDELVGTLCTTDTLTVGTHDIVQADDWDNPNYDITFVKGTLTVRAGKVTVNGTGYDNVTDAFNALLKNKGSATFNDTGIVYDGMTFQRGATLTVEADESWTVTNNGGTSLIATKIPGKMNLTVDGTLELSGDIFVAPAGEADTVVTVTNFMLDASITVGKESNGATDAMAYLSFNDFDNEKQAEYRITLTTNGVVRSLNATKLVIADVFATAPADYEITETAIDGGWEYTLRLIPTIDITIKVDGTFVTNVTMNGESAVGTVKLPKGTTAVALTLEADQGILTIPVYKFSRDGGDTWSVTNKTPVIAVADGDTLFFTAAAAEIDEDATEEETKQAIKDAIDPGPAHDDAVAKIDAVTGDGTDQVPAKELATWITESKVSSAEIAESDYVAASANLGAAGLIDEDDAEIGCSNATVKASEDAANLVLTINLKPNGDAESEPITSEGVAKYIQVSDEMGEGFEAIDPNRVTVDDDEVTIEPDPAKEKEFFKVVLVKDDGATSEVKSQVIAIATRTTTDVAAGKKVREAVSVAWTDTDGSPIPLQKVVSLDAVTPGDLLFAWNADNEVYDCWMLSATKVWEPQTTVKVSGEEVEENKPQADRTFALGEVIWLERQDTSKPLHLCGGVNATADVPEINEGMNLLSAPNFEAIDLDVKYPTGTAVEGDEVTLPIPDKSPKTFTFKDNAWGYQGFIKVGDKGIKPGRVTATKDEKMLIPAGCGFWYNRKTKAE